VTVYASWNGATAVHAWRVLAGANPGALTALTTVPRAGFETAIALRTAAPWFSVQALSADGGVLGTSPAAHA
jgi:hypothetical protein